MIVALDTSSTTAVAILHEHQVLAQASQYQPRGHAEVLAGMVRDALAQANADASHVTSVVVGTGPGPFTGLRVGLMTAVMLARSWDVPVRGWCSLDAIGAASGAGEVTVVADARRKEVYWATYVDGLRVAGPHVSAPHDVPVRGVVVGRGAAMYPDVFGEARTADPDPAWLARVVAAQLDAGTAEFPTTALYLRRPDVHGQ